MVATEKQALAQELRAVQEGAALYAASDWGQFVAMGPDTAAFLHRMLSNEVQKLKIGEGRYQGLLDRKGMVLSLFYLLRLSEQEFLGVTPPQLKEKTIGLLLKMKFIEKVEIRDVSQERGLLFLIGPKAETLKTEFPSGAKWTLWTEETFGVPWMTVSGPKAAIDERVASLSGQAVRLSDTAVRLVRMAAGFPEYGVDLDERHILLESPVPVAYQRNKGCYPGQEVVERISAYGKGRTPKRLVPFSLPGERPLEKGTEIVKDGVKIGTVTSALFNPWKDVTQVLASVETKYWEEASADIGQCEFLSPPVA